MEMILSPSYTALQMFVKSDFGFYIHKCPCVFTALDFSNCLLREQVCNRALTIHILEVKQSEGKT